jgi:hypothetical protein
LIVELMGQVVQGEECTVDEALAVKVVCYPALYLLFVVTAPSLATLTPLRCQIGS